MSKSKKTVAAVMTAVVLGATLASTAPASAWIRHGYGGFHGGGYGFRGGYGGYRGHRGLGVGAAVGLGVGAAALGAVAGAAAANSQYYNGYPVYSDGTHPAYGYDYYPDHGGYYGPY